MKKELRRLPWVIWRQGLRFFRALVCGVEASPGSCLRNARARDQSSAENVILLPVLQWLVAYSLAVRHTGANETIPVDSIVLPIARILV